MIEYHYENAYVTEAMGWSCMKYIIKIKMPLPALPKLSQKGFFVFAHV